MVGRLRSSFAMLLVGALVGLAGCQGDQAADAVPEDGGAGQEGVTAAASEWTGEAPAGGWTGATAVTPASGEGHFTSLTKLTNGGTNAEAYFAPDGERLIFQSTWPGVSECDQMYTMNLDGSDLQLVSTGEGRTTCGFFFPGREVVLFSSTHLVGAACPPPPDRSQGYVWGLFDYDVFTRDLATGDVVQLTSSPGYDAEATLSPDGSTIIFTSTRSGDLDLWAMDADGSNPRQLTDALGYEGGAFFSPDGSQIVYRAFHPENAEETADYEALLAQNLVRGGRLEVYVMNADGSNVRQVTTNRASNFAPYFHPDGQRIVWSSNMGDPTGRSFQVYMINVDGTEQEQITNDGFFNSFPMFSPDGSQLVFSSDRGAPGPGEINVFLADWSDVSAAAPR
jgi:Tol biopolymer transport system component